MGHVIKSSRLPPHFSEDKSLPLVQCCSCCHTKELNIYALHVGCNNSKKFQIQSYKYHLTFTFQQEWWLSSLQQQDCKEVFAWDVPSTPATRCNNILRLSTSNSDPLDNQQTDQTTASFIANLFFSRCSVLMDRVFSILCGRGILFTFSWELEWQKNQNICTVSQAFVPNTLRME